VVLFKNSRYIHDNEVTYQDNEGLSWERIYDNGNELSYQNNKGTFMVKLYDKNNNCISFKPYKNNYEFCQGKSSIQMGIKL
jgi:hypothetical protein